MSARFIPAGAIALFCVVCSAESQSFKAQSSQRVILTPCRLPGVDDALFILAGGPGQAATENADFFARTFAKVRRERDIVMVDQRGTGGSNGLHCDL